MPHELTCGPTPSRHNSRFAVPLDRTLGVPHKGWHLDNVIDLREDADLEYGEYETCQFCGQEQIRYVHILSHPSYTDAIRVGCVCAEHLTDDYVTPRRREQALRNRGARRVNWLKRRWKISKKGNEYPETRDGYHVGVYGVGTGKFKAWIGKRRGTRVYPSSDQAKLGIFDALEKLRAKRKES